MIEDQEPDPALGNGGLGTTGSLLYGSLGNLGHMRLMAAVSVTATVCSSRRSENGYQVRSAGQLAGRRLSL